MGGVCTRNGNGCGKICKDAKKGNITEWENPSDNSTRGLVAREAPGQAANPGGGLLTPRARSRLFPSTPGGVPSLCSQKIAAVALVAIAATVVICVLSLPAIALFSGTDTTTTTTITSTTMTNTTTSITATITTITVTSTTATTTLASTTTRPPSAPLDATTSQVIAAPAAAADLHATTTTWSGYSDKTTVQNLFEPTTTIPTTTTQERTVQLSITLENLDYNRLMEDEELTTDVKRRVTGAIVSEVGIYGIGEDNVDLELRGGSVLVWATLQTETVTAEVVRRGLNASSTTLAERLESSVKQVSGIDLASTGNIKASNIRILSKDEELGVPQTNYFFVPLVLGGGCFCLVAMIVACVARRSDKSKHGYNLANGQAFQNGADDFGAPVRGAQMSSTAKSKDQPSDDFMHREFIQTAGDMGFTRDVAIATLARANNDTDAALDMLLAEQ